MAAYKYRALDANGVEQTGHMEAESLGAARESLRNQRLEALEITLCEESDTAMSSRRLTAADSDQVVRSIAQLGMAEMPLSAGLRAAAAESGSSEAALVLNSFAARLDRGESLERVLAESDTLFSGHISRLIAIANRTGDLGHALCELDEHHRSVRELRYTIMLGFAYPVVVCCFSIGIILCLLLFITTPFERMSIDFGLQLPTVTELIFWWRDTGLLIVAAFLVVVMILVAIVRSALGRAGWLRLMETLPLFGALVQWSGIAEWASILSVLIKSQVPIPEALRLAADGTKNAHVGRLSHQLASDVEKGHSIADALAANRQFPATLAPIVRWGEETGMLGDSFATCHQIFLRRLRDRATLLRAIIGPLIFIAVGCCLQFVVGGLLLPLVDLIQGLA